MISDLHPTLRKEALLCQALVPTCAVLTFVLFLIPASENSVAQCGKTLVLLLMAGLTVFVACYGRRHLARLRRATWIVEHIAPETKTCQPHLRGKLVYVDLSGSPREDRKETVERIQILSGKGILALQGTSTVNVYRDPERGSLLVLEMERKLFLGRPLNGT